MVSSRTQLRVGVAVRHGLLREGLQHLLQSADFEVVGAADAAEAPALALACAPEVLLLGVRAPLASALGTVEQLRSASPAVKVLLMSEDGVVPSLAGALLAGARGVVDSDIAPELLVRAIRAVARGEYWVERRSVFDVLERLQELARPAAGKLRPAGSLTPRERQVVTAISAGESNREIASRLGIAEATVKAHVTAVYDKLGVSNRAELTARVLTEGLGGKPASRRPRRRR